MLTAIVIIVFILAFFSDYLPSSGRWPLRERILYLAVFSVGFVILLLTSLDVRLPSFSNALTSILKDILPPDLKG